MSHEPVQVDPYQQLNSDSPEKIKAGLIVLRERAALGDLGRTRGQAAPCEVTRLKVVKGREFRSA
jgi:hypothetical protein